MGALMQAAQLGVEPNTPLGQAYLIPYANKKMGIVECQFQLGYKGMLDLAYRSGEISVMAAHVVYENDQFDYALGLDDKLSHKPARSNRGVAIFVYAFYKGKSGSYGYEVMSIEDIKQHAKQYSKSYSDGPWVTNFEEMAKKTVIKKVLKYAPLRSDFVTLDTTTNTIEDGKVTVVSYESSPPIDVAYHDEDEPNPELDRAIEELNRSGL
jgi:recombination protein RecT